jgi:hypothetical protein
LGAVINPAQALFISTMGAIRSNQGDPPHMAGMEQYAAAVFQGQLDPLQALMACSPPPTQQQLAFTLQAAQFSMPQMVNLIRLTAVIGAALALPRSELSKFLPAATATAASAPR